MEHFDFLGELILIGSSAIAIILVFQKFKIPPVIGLIFTGIILGPSGFGIVHDSGLITTLAELGVILLLFTIGLEFSLGELKRLKKIVVVGGTSQIILTAIAIAFASFWLMDAVDARITTGQAIFLGLAFAASSTAICLKTLSDRNELDLQYGKIALGILIFQDIAIVPLMIAITFLSPSKHPTLEVVSQEVGLIAFFGVAVFGGFQLVMPRMVKVITSLHAKEVLVLGALVLCFGSAYLTSMIGLSLALGSFVAGMVIASTDESHRIASAIEPFREALTSIFFVSVGLLLDVRMIDLPLFIAIALGVLVIKAIIVGIVSLGLGYSLRVSMMAGMSLAQIGEFSFVLAEVGLKNGVINDALFHSMLAIIVVTMVVTPAMIAVAPHVADQVIPALGFIPLPSRDSDNVPASPAESTIIGPGEVHAAIIGFGVNGQNVAAVLRATNISYTVLEIDREVVHKMKLRGEPIYYGDCTEKKAMQRAGIDHARAIVIGISDTKAIAQSIRAIREINAKAFIIVRAPSLPDVEHLYKAGADVVVTEKFETSIQIFSQLLKHFTIEPELILEQQEIIRRDCEKIFLQVAHTENKGNGSAVKA